VLLRLAAHLIVAVLLTARWQHNRCRAQFSASNNFAGRLNWRSAGGSRGALKMGKVCEFCCICSVEIDCTNGRSVPSDQSLSCDRGSVQIKPDPGRIRSAEESSASAHL